MFRVKAPSNRGFYVCGVFFGQDAFPGRHCLKHLRLLDLLKRTATEWGDHNGWIFAGAMTAFAALALAPLILIVVRVAQTFGHEQRILAGLGTALGMLIGAAQAHSVDATVRASNDSNRGLLPIGLAALVTVAAGSRFVYAMQKAIQTMWSVDSDGPQTIWTTLRDQLVSALTATIVMVALVVMVVGGALLFSGQRPSGGPILGDFGTRVAIVLGGCLVLVPTFAALFKWLPHTRIAWGDVWVGATVSAVFFTAGQVVIGMYLSARHVQTVYGAASAVVVLLLWLYYTAYTFLLGAEFTQVYARNVGSLFQRETI